MPNVIINAEICKGCELCVESCPKKIISIGKSPNGQGYFTAVWVDENKACTGCALCAEMCPDIAIEVFK
jgi:2-oxoglutarate ferredoxin oxidoreductase subunit delta